MYSNDGGKLAVGLSTGEVKVFDPMSNHPLFTLGDPVTCTEVRLHVQTPNVYKHAKFTFDVCLQVYPSPATSLAYSGDDRMVAVGYQNGVLKLWKGLQCFATRGTIFEMQCL